MTTMAEQFAALRKAWHDFLWTLVGPELTTKHEIDRDKILSAIGRYYAEAKYLPDNGVELWMDVRRAIDEALALAAWRERWRTIGRLLYVLAIYTLAHLVLKVI